MRKCKICDTNLPIGADGVMCITCRTVHRPDFTKLPKIILTKERTGYAGNVWRYGLAIKQQAELYKQQGKRCAICSRIRFLVLDHDHKTNKARGYLCRGCNTKLSGFDNPVFAGRAREYLDNPPANNLSDNCK